MHESCFWVKNKCTIGESAITQGAMQGKKNQYEKTLQLMMNYLNNKIVLPQTIKSVRRNASFIART
jgi:hypothetical protein